MPKKVIISPSNNAMGLMPDRWVLGTGLETDGLYITHMAPPLMIVRYPVDEDGLNKKACTVFLRGEVDPETMERLLKEAWEIVKGHHDRLQKLRAAFRCLATVN